MLLNYQFFRTKCLGNTSYNQEVAKVDKDLLCACENDKLVTLDGVVAMRDLMKPYAFKRVVCPQPTIKKCWLKQATIISLIRLWNYNMSLAGNIKLYCTFFHILFTHDGYNFKLHKTKSKIIKIIKYYEHIFLLIFVHFKIV